MAEASLDETIGFPRSRSLAMKIAVRIVAVVVFVLISGTVVADDLPDLGKTPGKSRPGLTKKTICATLWGKDERHVTAAMKKEAFSRYGYTGYSDPRCVADSHGKTCEIDHLVSRELGGADVVDNLWPQSYGSPWNAHMKDKLENRLRPSENDYGHILYG
ncbi:MAG: HNH endonuclease [Proteobacteria bacterium]|nr:HNH endonuclease [Pseudomonadota bacterium]